MFLQQSTCHCLSRHIWSPASQMKGGERGPWKTKKTRASSTDPVLAEDHYWKTLAWAASPIPASWTWHLGNCRRFQESRIRKRTKKNEEEASWQSTQTSQSKSWWSIVFCLQRMERRRVSQIPWFDDAAISTTDQDWQARVPHGWLRAGSMAEISLEFYVVFRYMYLHCMQRYTTIKGEILYLNPSVSISYYLILHEFKP